MSQQRFINYVMLVVVAAAIALVATWQFSRRPDVIPPAIYGAGMKSADMSPVEVSMYEYTDRDAWITNGRSITLRIPIAYLTFDAALRGGAQSVISIDFDGNTFESWTIAESAAPAAGTDALRTQKIGAVLSIFGKPFDQRLAQELYDAKHGKPSSFYKDYALIDGSVCGYDMFWVGRPKGVTTYVVRHPFDEANAFARVSASGDYDAWVRCEPDRLGAWCHATREFDGFPVTVYFDDDRLCELDVTFDKTREMLGRFLVDRTPARDGWGLID